VAHAVTDCNGFYSIVNVVPGTYSISAQKRGYGGSVVVGVAVQSGAVALADVRLAGGVNVVTLDGPSMTVSLVNPRQTADVYKVAAYDNPLFSNATTIGSLLQFVPGVQVGGGLSLIK